MTRKKEAERLDLIKELKRRFNIQPGDTLFTNVLSVSRSGMSRKIDVYLMRNNRPIKINRYVSIIAEYRVDKKTRAIIVSGCGMDMGFSIVYSFSHCLFPDGFGVKCCNDGCDFRLNTKDGTNVMVGFRCKSNDCLTNKHQFLGRNGDSSGWDNDGGYALKQEWLS